MIEQKQEQRPRIIDITPLVDYMIGIAIAMKLMGSTKEEVDIIIHSDAFIEWQKRVEKRYGRKEAATT